MSIRYDTGTQPAAACFTELYQASTLGARRPLDDPGAVQQMIQHANLLITAWDGSLLVGVARSFTDFSYIAYLADLVVRDSHQRLGIGVELVRQTQEALGERAKIILWAAPEAEAYYPQIGFRRVSSAWVLGAREQLSSSK